MHEPKKVCLLFSNTSRHLTTNHGRFRSCGSFDHRRTSSLATHASTALPGVRHEVLDSGPSDVR